MRFRLRVAARSDVGLGREGNEDSGYAGQRLQVVADGIGGHIAGEIASSIAIRAMLELEDNDVAANVESALSLAVLRANEALRARVAAEPRLDGMGTTVTAAYNDGDRFVIAQVGDSRAYMLRENELQMLTRDQTWVQTLVDEGRITAKEAENHPQRSVLMQALDGRGDLTPELLPVQVEVGDRLLLNSDGLSDYVDEETIHQGLAAGEPSDAVDALVQAALESGAPDNVTVVVADVLAADDDETPNPEVQLVGAVAAPTPRARADDETRSTPVQAAVEPRARPRRRRKWPVVLALVVVVGALGGLAFGAYSWWSRQWYVGVDDGRVAVFQGLPDPVFGLDLSRLDTTYRVSVSRLPEFSQERLEQGITTDDEQAAHDSAAALSRQANGFE